MNIFEHLKSPEKREKFLLVLTGLLLVFVIGPVGYYYYGADAKKLKIQRTKLGEQLETLEKETRNAAEIKERLEKLTAISLPSNADVAQSAYQNWLLDQARASGLRETRVDQGSMSTVKDFYSRYTMTLRGRASLAQLATFLGRFQRTDHLQLIRSVSISPLRESQEMDVTIKVESLVLKQAKPSTSLTMNDKPDALSADAERKMRQTIVDRALFSAYVPPTLQRTANVPPTPPPSFGHAPYTYVTAVVEVDGKLQAWFDVRTEAKKYRLFEGQSFRLGGTLTCLVKRIDFDKVVIEAARDLFTIRVGKSFIEYED